MKENARKIENRKVNGHEINCFVYEWKGKMEGAVFIHNTTGKTYREKLTFPKMENCKFDGAKTSMWVELKPAE